MPYVSSSRVSGSRKTSGLAISGATLGSRIDADAITGYEAVYSFRTGGKIAAQDTTTAVKTDPESEVYRPTGSIADRLIYRRKFLERQISAVMSRPGSPSHFLVGDMGHEFASAKSKFVGGENSVRHFASSINTSRTYSNVCPSAIYNMTSGGSLAQTSPLIDPFSGYFGSKGFRFSTQGSTFGPTLQSVRASAANHISEMNPFDTKVSIFAALLELAKGDIPSVFKGLQETLTLITRMKASGVRDAAQAVGSGYLNNVFGWTPLLRDVDGAIKTLLVLDNMLFPEDSTRRSVRRILSTRGGITTSSIPLKFGPPLEGSTTVSANNWGWNTYTASGSGIANVSLGSHPAQTSVLEEISLWTTARFNTTARPSPTNNGYLDKAIELLGLEITPEVLWQVTPWSWLIDWFSNMGTVIGNLTTLGLSNTILNYAYSTVRMKTHVGVHVDPAVVASGTGLRAFSGNFDFFYTNDFKVRIAASPFGFDVALDQLNAGQWAILSALGLARSR